MPSMIPAARDDTLRKGFQRIQENNRSAFEHAGAQQPKRVPSNAHAAHGGGHHMAAHSQQKPVNMSPGYRQGGGYPMSKESPREHVKMRQPDPRMGGPRITSAHPNDNRRPSRPMSHHQAVSLDCCGKQQSLPASDAARTLATPPHARPAESPSSASSCGAGELRPQTTGESTPVRAGCLSS